MDLARREARRKTPDDLLFRAPGGDTVGSLGSNRASSSRGQRARLAGAAAPPGVRRMTTPGTPPLPLIAACLLATCLAACSSRCSGSAPTAVLGASAADLAAIGRLHQEYVAAHNASDADRLMKLWTDDAVLMPMDEPTLSGRKAISEHYEEFFDQNPSEIEI